jgi:PDZ domain-containing protein
VSRRSLTLLLASVLAVLLAGGAVQAPVPYVALGPGPTYNTIGKFDGEPLLAIEGRPTYPTDGHLDLTTVGVEPDLTLVEALRGWFDRDLAVVPREVVYPPDQSDDEVERQNAKAMTTSQSSATTAAARQLGLRTAVVRVQEVPDGSPSSGLLQEGDVLTTLDGRRLRDAAELRGLIALHEVGDVVQVGYERDGAAAVVGITTGSSQEPGQARPVIGVVTEEEPIEAPFDVEVTLEDVGGPSAGLMFSLGILELLGEESLTGGKFIAGTGEITADGTVRPIGGISQKLVAAKAKGADAFLVPEANCAEAVVRAPDDLPLLRVGSLGQALAAALLATLDEA